MDNYPADYMRPFLHKLIDNGLDMYVGTGVHTMQGIEIYKGRPIFYNQGNLGERSDPAVRFHGRQGQYRWPTIRRAPQEA